MAVSINRVLYAQQTVIIKAKGGNPAQVSYILPSQSATADETIPQEDVLVLGKLGGAGRLQKDVASCKCSIKAYILDSSKAGGGFTIGNPTAGFLGVNDSVMETMLQDIRLDAIAGTPVNVNLHYNSTEKGGFEFEGACSNIGIDVSKGNFPMLDLSFDGVGQINKMAVDNTGITASDDNAKADYIDTAVPLTSEDITMTSDAHEKDTVSSLKFSLDMPTETLSRLGGKIEGKTSEVNSDNVTFSKPPFKSSLTVEGQALTELSKDAKVDATANILNGFDVGVLDVTLIGSALSSRSVNQAVGDIGATYNIAVEGTDAKFQTQVPDIA